MKGEAAILKSLKKQGYGILPPDQWRVDLPHEFMEFWRQIHPYTMTSAERGFGLYTAVKHLCSRGLPGNWLNAVSGGEAPVCSWL